MNTHDTAAPPNLEALCAANPHMRALAEGRPMFWRNPDLTKAASGIAASGFRPEDARDAEARLARFAPFLAHVFPETRAARGVIESALKPVPAMRRALERHWGTPLSGELLLKMDSHLPVSGSIKARGGFYEVLLHAESLALEHGLLSGPGDDYARLAGPEAREFFSGFALAVGSTGNLGLSVGLMGAALGFASTVHMSADARQWKKDLLRKRGVTVIEYEGDYEAAVRAGREAARHDPRCHFVDDENSAGLFLGYSVAGLRLPAQLKALGITVSEERPLYVYLPCGVGGGPGGVTFGLKLALGDAAHCFFAEPVEAPAVSAGLVSGLDDGISAADLGRSGRTAADGLAVSRPSALVCGAMRHLLDGLFTVGDDELFALLHLLAQEEGIRIEPSAAAGFPGLRHIIADAARPAPQGGAGPVAQRAVSPVPEGAVHVVWATGGGLVPPDEWKRYDEKGAALMARPL